ncbi:AraC family transcriptional regulator [Sphingobacterium daejeonense]|uniref:helix-turn-helix domain-containing protein n=1 Tax=Sphingobacterium daejeonense TaxID=371142 RepID=UPI0021A34EC3|nr:AraC family transcriptional regulator [Sphingobacterium daejeonense]MCT1532902.1 AraC family transcriptional regulator [Sphingobacterium daejeonense]
MKTVTLKELYGKDHLHELLDSTDHQQLTNGFEFKWIKNELIEGKLMKYHDDLVTVSFQEWKLHQPFHLRVNHQFPMIKVQFEIEGNSNFESVNNKSIVIPGNHYQFINIPKTNGYIAYNSSRKVLDIHIEEDYLFELLKTQGYSEKQLREHFLLKNYTFYREATVINEHQKKLIEELLNHRYQSEFAKQFIRTKALELIITVFAGANNQLNAVKWSQNDIEIMLNIKSYLDEHFHEELHLKTLTRKFGINEYKLKNAFKDLFDDTVFSYIRKQKLKRAKYLLLNSDLEIKEIAFLTGFKYSHHFSKVYFDHYHIKPQEFRIQHTS